MAWTLVKDVASAVFSAYTLSLVLAYFFHVSIGHLAAFVWVPAAALGVVLVVADLKNGSRSHLRSRDVQELRRDRRVGSGERAAWLFRHS